MSTVSIDKQSSPPTPQKKLPMTELSTQGVNREFLKVWISSPQITPHGMVCPTRSHDTCVYVCMFVSERVSKAWCVCFLSAIYRGKLASGRGCVLYSLWSISKPLFLSIFYTLGTIRSSAYLACFCHNWRKINEPLIDYFVLLIFKIC